MNLQVTRWAGESLTANDVFDHEVIVGVDELPQGIDYFARSSDGKMLWIRQNEIVPEDFFWEAVS